MHGLILCSNALIVLAAHKVVDADSDLAFQDDCYVAFRTGQQGIVKPVLTSTALLKLCNLLTSFYHLEPRQAYGAWKTSLS